MRPIKAVTRIIVGLVFGAIAWLALTPALVVFQTDPDSGTLPVISFCMIVGVSILLTFLAPSIRRAFGRGFLIAGTSLLALPLSTFLLSGHAMNEVVASADAADQAYAAAGAGVAGMAMTGVAAFVGLIGGGIFIIIGLVLALGGKRQVIIVRENAQ